MSKDFIPLKKEQQGTSDTFEQVRVQHEGKSKIIVTQDIMDVLAQDPHYLRAFGNRSFRSLESFQSFTPAQPEEVTEAHFGQIEIVEEEAKDTASQSPKKGKR